MSDVTSRPVKRIGHKGADHIAPGNTRESFDAALREGVDMVEFDVLPERPDGSGRLVLAHDFEDAARRSPLTLEEGLEHFAQDAWAGVELDLDLKMPGYEQRVVEALRRYGLTARTLVSTMEPASLRVVRELEPAVRLGWSVPKVRRDYMAHAITRATALGVAQYVKRILPARAAREIREGRIEALMSHWALVTPRLADAITAAGGELYVWTVDDPRRIAELERIGVTGVITNDPRLFRQ
jgi:glycerophosphoryl diester phosphodiesterase